MIDLNDTYTLHHLNLPLSPHYYYSLFYQLSNHIVFVSHLIFFFFFSSRRRHTRFKCDWSSDVCSSDLAAVDRFSYGRFHLRAGFQSRSQRQAVWQRPSRPMDSSFITPNMKPKGYGECPCPGGRKNVFWIDRRAMTGSTGGWLETAFTFSTARSSPSRR